MSNPGNALRWRTQAVLAVSAVLALGVALGTPGGAAAAPKPSPSPSPGYVSYFDGNATNAETTPVGGALLAGGGTDSDAGMKWLLAQGGTRPGGGFGDVVVLRTSGSNGYNKYLLKFGANSVNSIVISSRAGADSAFVTGAIARAEVVFIAGGDQATYVNMWTGTQLQTAINDRVAHNYPIGGTSAGLAVLGGFVFAALNDTTTSAIALANPYDPTITITERLFTVPRLGGVITDSHFVARDRMGRLVTFLARLQQDGRAALPTGIGIDERSAVAVDSNGLATIFGAGKGAYFLSVNSVQKRVCASGTPLTFKPVTAVHVAVGGTFNIASWTGPVSYNLLVEAGVLSPTNPY